MLNLETKKTRNIFKTIFSTMFENVNVEVALNFIYCKKAVQVFTTKSLLTVIIMCVISALT